LLLAALRGPLEQQKKLRSWCWWIQMMMKAAVVKCTVSRFSRTSQQQQQVMASFQTMAGLFKGRVQSAVMACMLTAAVGWWRRGLGS
jgi:hypothetical protein